MGKRRLKIATSTTIFCLRQGSILAYFVASQNHQPKMPGKHIIGVVAELKRENEGEYVIPMCTVFGLEDEERLWLIRNKDEDGIEIGTSAYKLMRILAKHSGLKFATNQN